MQQEATHVNPENPPARQKIYNLEHQLRLEQAKNAKLQSRLKKRDAKFFELRKELAQAKVSAKSYH